jgi:hypothetical protein
MSEGKGDLTMADKLYKTMANTIAKTVRHFYGKTQNEIVDYLQRNKTIDTRRNDLNDIAYRTEKLCSDYSGKNIQEIENDLNSLPARAFECIYQDIPLLSKIIPEERKEQTHQENDNKFFGNDRIGKWIEAYLSGKIDASIFSCLIVLEKFLHKKLPKKVNETINSVIACLSLKDHWSTKEEQNMKNALKEIENAFNTGDKDGVASVVDKIRDMVKRRT